MTPTICTRGGSSIAPSVERPGKILYVYPLAKTLAAIRTALPRYCAK